MPDGTLNVPARERLMCEAHFISFSGFIAVGCFINKNKMKYSFYEYEVWLPPNEARALLALSTALCAALSMTFARSYDIFALKLPKAP